MNRNDCPTSIGTGVRSPAEYASGKPNEHICFLRDANGMVFSLKNMALGAETAVRYPAEFHLGFIQPDPANVDRIH